ncbi:MAG: GTP-binding protein [Lachnospiraceae bacterium]|nr:GTP-binding protein [Lachnospiraceae bacterium]
MSKREVPIVVITGYLGSGKTTLMQNILKQENRKIALIVNDMGSINIDASILNKTGNQVVQVEMVEMQNGCICCTLRDEFMAQIERLSKDKSIEAIFVEASGISEPSSIAGAFVNYEEMTEDTRVYLKSVVSVVDVDRIYREFLHDLMSDEECEDGDVINLIMDQIEFCNLMILNKIDLLTEEQLEEVKEGLRSIQRKAEMITCKNGEVDLDVILNREDFDYDEVEAYSSVQQALNNCEHEDVKACVDEYGISSFVFEDKRPFNRDAFDAFVENYPGQLIRSKGYIWFSDDPEHVQLFEQAGRNASVTELTPWVSAWPEEELAPVLEDFPDLKDEWDEVYGDRCNQVVFIGKGYEKSEIVKLIYDCIDKDPEACLKSN